MQLPCEGREIYTHIKPGWFKIWFTDSIAKTILYFDSILIFMLFLPLLTIVTDGSPEYLMEASKFMHSLNGQVRFPSSQRTRPPSVLRKWRALTHQGRTHQTLACILECTPPPPPGVLIRPMITHWPVLLKQP